MNDSTQAPPCPPESGTLAVLAPVVEILAELIKALPALPAPYVSVERSGGGSLQLATPAAFEQWRTALDISSCDVELHAYDGDAWLGLDALVGGVWLRLTGYGLPLTYAQATTQQELARAQTVQVVPLASLATAAGGDR